MYLWPFPFYPADSTAGQVAFLKGEPVSLVDGRPDLDVDAVLGDAIGESRVAPFLIRKVYEVDPMTCPHKAWPLHEDCEALPPPRQPCSTHSFHECGQMKVVAFLTDFSVVDRIIEHLKLTFVAKRPPPPQVAYQELLLAADPPAEYFP